MRKEAFMILGFFTMIHYCHGQKIDTIYYSKNETISNKRNFKYYVVSRQDSNRVRTFTYNKSGQILSSGNYLSPDLKKPTGLFCFYEKDRIKRIEIYEPSKYPNLFPKSALKYIAPQPDSLKLRITFFENKKIETIGYQGECCSRHGTWLYFAKDGSLIAKENYVNNMLEGEFFFYFFNIITEHGYYKQGKKDSEWTYFDLEGKLKKTIFYSQGKKLKTIR
jgi:antitoxin component YwqK of YwqJK toxin-antitoxin module